MNERQDAAGRLLDAIGEISDEMIKDAEEAVEKNRDTGMHKLYLRRRITRALATVASVFLALGMGLYGWKLERQSSPAEENPKPGTWGDVENDTGISPSNSDSPNNAPIIPGQTKEPAAEQEDNVTSSGEIDSEGSNSEGSNSEGFDRSNHYSDNQERPIKPASDKEQTVAHPSGESGQPGHSNDPSTSPGQTMKPSEDGDNSVAPPSDSSGQTEGEGVSPGDGVDYGDHEESAVSEELFQAPVTFTFDGITYQKITSFSVGTDTALVSTGGFLGEENQKVEIFRIQDHPGLLAICLQGKYFVYQQADVSGGDAVR